MIEAFVQKYGALHISKVNAKSNKNILESFSDLYAALHSFIFISQLLFE